MLLQDILLNKRNLIFIFSLLLISGAALYSCAAPDKYVIHVAAASNLNYLFPELKAEYEKICSGVVLDVTFGSSGKLTSQITEGAPYNIFFAANKSYPEKLYEKGFAEEIPLVYAIGKLVLFKAEGNIKKENIFIELNNPENIIALPNPELAPYGKAAIEFLETFNIQLPPERVLSADNAGIALHYSLTGANLGFIPGSALYSEELKKFDTASFFLLPADSYKPVEQALIVISYKDLKNEITVLKEFVFSDAGQNIFLKYGYGGISE